MVVENQSELELQNSPVDIQTSAGRHTVLVNLAPGEKKDLLLTS